MNDEHIQHRRLRATFVAPFPPRVRHVPASYGLPRVAQPNTGLISKGIWQHASLWTLARTPRRLC